MPLPETERLYFRAHHPGDRGDYCAMEMDAAVRKYVGGFPVPSKLPNSVLKIRFTVNLLN